MDERFVVLLRGDGIGPEITAATLEVLAATGVPIRWVEMPAGVRAIADFGVPVPPETLAAIGKYKYALKGPFTTPAESPIRSGNWYIRRELRLFAGIRPIVNLEGATRYVIIRENIEDLYGSVEWMATEGVAHAVKLATRDGSRRVARFAFDWARRFKRRRITIVHKANNLPLTDGIFLRAARETSTSYPDIECDDLFVDAAAALLATGNAQMDVLLMQNTYGDILSNVAAAVSGGLALTPSANYGEGIIVAEASHGSAPELTGRGTANPYGLIGAAAMLLDSMSFPMEANAIRAALAAALRAGVWTPDIGGTSSTRDVARDVAERTRIFMSTNALT